MVTTVLGDKGVAMVTVFVEKGVAMVTISLFQATEKKIEMTALQNNNKQILCNIIPAHFTANWQDKITYICCYGNSFTILGH